MEYEDRQVWEAARIIAEAGWLLVGPDQHLYTGQSPHVCVLCGASEHSAECDRKHLFGTDTWKFSCELPYAADEVVA